MSNRKLSHVLALAKLASFAQAAYAVHLSQPAFSRSIQSIEEQFGVKLFDRGNRKIVPTPFGKLVIARAERILKEEKGLHRDVELMKSLEYGDAHIGLGPIPAAVLMTSVLSRITRDYPKIRVHVEVTHWRNLLAQLEAEEIDLFIADIRELLTRDHLDIVKLPELPLKFYSRADHPIQAKGVIRPDQLLEFPLGSFRFPEKTLSELCRRFRYEEDPALLWHVECDNLLVLSELAQASNLLILGPAPAFDDQLRTNKLVEVKLKPTLDIKSHFGIVSLKSRMTSPATDLLISLTIDEMREAYEKVKGRISKAARPASTHKPLNAPKRAGVPKARSSRNS